MKSYWLLSLAIIASSKGMQAMQPNTIKLVSKKEKKNAYAHQNGKAGASKRKREELENREDVEWQKAVNNAFASEDKIKQKLAILFNSYKAYKAVENNAELESSR